MKNAIKRYRRNPSCSNKITNLLTKKTETTTQKFEITVNCYPIAGIITLIVIMITALAGSVYSVPREFIIIIIVSIIAVFTIPFLLHIVFLAKMKKLSEQLDESYNYDILQK